MNTVTWMQWREQIIEVIRARYGTLLADIDQDDVDWEAWRPLYEQGYTAYTAVSDAFSAYLMSTPSEGYAA